MTETFQLLWQEKNVLSFLRIRNWQIEEFVIDAFLKSESIANIGLKINKNEFNLWSKR